MSTWILILYAWTISQHAGSGIATAEFTSRDKCESAAQTASKEFNGWQSKIYYVCVEK